MSEKADDGARGRDERRGMDGRCDRRYDCRRAIASVAGIVTGNTSIVMGTSFTSGTAMCRHAG